MKKVIFIATLLTSIIFASCNAPTEVKVEELSTSKIGIEATFTDFFQSS